MGKWTSTKLLTQKIFNIVNNNLNNSLPNIRSNYTKMTRGKVPMRFYCTTSSNINNEPSTSKFNGKVQPVLIDTDNPVVTIRLECGLPTVIVPLPSRNEKCQFTLRPISDTVGSFCEFLMNEDKGIEQVSLLYNALNIDDYNMHRQNVLMKRLEVINMALRPMEIVVFTAFLNFIKIYKKIEKECEDYSSRILWTGFCTLGFQTGVFARLTWWEYSWDIMEPVTYFATFSTVLATLAYYLMTPHTRLFTRRFYKKALQYHLDLDKFNRLENLKTEITMELKVLRDQHKLRLEANSVKNAEKEISDAENWLRNVLNLKTTANV